MSNLFNRNSDDEWKKYGESDPYYGVVSLDKFHKDKLDDSAKHEFFQSGRDYLDFIRKIIRTYIDPGFDRVDRALDFGFGVGRCIIPIAAFSKTAVGVEVSEAMRQETIRNAATQSVDNLELIISNDELGNVSGPFEFIHSFAVFQHISPNRGEKIIERLLERLGEGGIIALHVIYGRRASAVVKAVGYLRKRVPLLHPLVNMLCGEKASKPLMEKNCYHVNNLLALLRNARCTDVHVEFEGQDEMQSCILFARKDSTKQIYDYESFFKQ